MIARLTVIAALLAAPMAVAQEPAREPASAAQLAAASAEADALIAGTGSPELFINVSRDGMAKVQHKASGLVCSYVPGAENNSLMVWDHPNMPRGDDVGCNADIGPAYMTYYATRYGPGFSAADSAHEAAQAIRDRWPDARPYEGMMARVEPPEGVTESEFVALLIGPEGSQRYTHALTAKVGEWVFKQRMTGDGDEDSIMANQMVAGVFFHGILQTAAGQAKR